MFDLQGDAKGFELALEFGPVVCPDLGGVPKNLNFFLSNRMGNCLAALAFD